MRKCYFKVVLARTPKILLVGLLLCIVPISFTAMELRWLLCSSPLVQIPRHIIFVEIVRHRFHIFLLLEDRRECYPRVYTFFQVFSCISDVWICIPGIFFCCFFLSYIIEMYLFSCLLFAYCWFICGLYLCLLCVCAFSCLCLRMLKLQRFYRSQYPNEGYCIS